VDYGIDYVMVAYDMFYSYVNGSEERVNNSSDGSGRSCAPNPSQYSQY